MGEGEEQQVRMRHKRLQLASFPPSSSDAVPAESCPPITYVLHLPLASSVTAPPAPAGKPNGASTVNCRSRHLDGAACIGEQKTRWRCGMRDDAAVKQKQHTAHGRCIPGGYGYGMTDVRLYPILCGYLGMVPKCYPISHSCSCYPLWKMPVPETICPPLISPLNPHHPCRHRYPIPSRSHLGHCSSFLASNHDAAQCSAAHNEKGIGAALGVFANRSGSATTHPPSL
jgi:hypothetical protein